MKIAIIGSRSLPKEWVEPKLKFLLEIEDTSDVEVISGGAPGTDTHVKEFCNSWNIPITEIRPIDPESKISYLFRNIEIITMADRIIAFWDGKSRGTRFVINYCKARDKYVEVHNFGVKE